MKQLYPPTNLHYGLQTITQMKEYPFIKKGESPIEVWVVLSVPAMAQFLYEKEDALPVEGILFDPDAGEHFIAVYNAKYNIWKTKNGETYSVPLECIADSQNCFTFTQYQEWKKNPLYPYRLELSKLSCESL